MAQIIRRLSEVKIREVTLPGSTLRRQHFMGPIVGGMAIKAQYGEMSTEKWTLRTSTGDNIFRLGNDIVCIQNIVECIGGGIYAIYKEYRRKSLFFSYPFSSDTLNIYIISEKSEIIKAANVSELDGKCVALPHRESFVAFLLLH